MFHVGQKVECIDAEGTSRLVLSGVYTIKAILPFRNYLWRDKIYQTTSVRLVEVDPGPEYEGFAPQRLRPIVERKTDISIFERMLKEKVVEIA